jgi:hypothetical protein
VALKLLKSAITKAMSMSFLVLEEIFQNNSGMPLRDKPS